MRILVTGVAGFIGMHCARQLIEAGHQVVGIDNLNDYYDVTLKEARLDELRRCEGDFYFARVDLADSAGVDALFREGRFDRVIHLAAQAGVRYSLENPRAYIDSNLVGFGNILEGCRHHDTGHLVYASSSSVYGANTRMPFSVHDNVDHPVSLYAATKKSNELMAHTYAHLYGLPVTGLRFFTVYGPWGRPDMAPFKFTRSILAGEPIEVYNYGRMRRDFTYIDDIVDGVLRVMDTLPEPDPEFSTDAPDPARSNAPYRVYNIGNHRPVALEDFIAALEDACGRKAQRHELPMQPGDVAETYADIDDLTAATGWHPQTAIEQGLPQFVAWYRAFYGV
ncbi:NAD-dependent epimerase [Halorhodospira halophila]|uniref:NAD-dependent epimerase/dehydratase n=1 Tax=Halorhodospira halophila (strain DSM 244 / SL1) TaxID=349124 RepID=A1WZ31_HALHL|nr:NAD-dependent epimerase [Halorhodospira halophila]ABM62943.1 NAD-dependent epimerase/dehydratase [Halorhodospira halophila SL1]MBK1727936.1 NAD-dependent epimerase [Halorhodospira halophila]